MAHVHWESNRTAFCTAWRRFLTTNIPCVVARHLGMLHEATWLKNALAVEVVGAYEASCLVGNHRSTEGSGTLPRDSMRKHPNWRDRALRRAAVFALTAGI
jgi:hypothetical protein